MQDFTRPSGRLRALPFAARSVYSVFLVFTLVGLALTVALTRLGLGLALGLTAIAVFDLSGPVAGVVLLQSTMPAAVFNFVFAERYNRDPDKVAAVILQSTLMAVLTLPLLVAWAITF